MTCGCKKKSMNEIKQKPEKVTVGGELFPFFITTDRGAKLIPLGQKGQEP